MASSATHDWRLDHAAVRPQDRRGIEAGIVCAYVLCYVLLDWVSYVYPIAPYAITVWNLSAGVSLALLLGFGLRYAPVTFVAAILAEVSVRHGSTGAVVDAAVYAVILAAGYTAVAAWLKKSRFDPTFGSFRDLILFMATTAGGAVAIAVVYVAAHVVAGSFSWSEFPGHVLSFGVGDVIGIATTTPFLLMMRARLARGKRFQLTTEGLLQALSIAAVIALAFHFEPEQAQKLLYLLFLPVVWISIRYGFEGATAALLATQLGLIGSLQLADYATESVIHFQLLMLALTVTGAFLGMASTLWRRAHQAVDSREAELKTIFATAPYAIVTVDEKFRVIDVNDAARAMFGLTADELKMFPLSRLISDLPADITAARAVAALAHRADGREFPVEVSFGSAVVDERIVYIGAVRDMAERMEMEEKLTERDHRLERTLRVAAAAEMASALAHELNQPLMAASTYVQALDLLVARRGGAADAELGDTMRKAVAEVERAAGIVRRLREFYRRDSGKAEAVGLQSLIDAALAPLMSHVERHRVDVSSAVAPGLPQLIVDRIQIEMVLHNLLRNALDSIVESQPDVRRITVDAQAGHAGFITIGVEDSGGGIKRCIAEQLFKSFVTSKIEGMGLGLAISRSIVERHGGRLWLERNRPGTRFTLTLPAEQ